MRLKIKPWINELPDYVAGRTIEEIKRKYNLKVVYKMASNENILGPCPQVKRYLKGRLSEINYYPDSDALKIREKLAEKYGILPGNVIMGNGTDQVIEMICDCFIDKGDNIVIADPNFLIYEKAALKCSGGVIKVPLNKKNFSQDLQGIAGAVNSRTKIIFLACPHNPSGTTITREEFAYIEKNTGSDVLIVLDEAYHDYMEDASRIDTINYVKNSPRIIALRTFSKIYGLAGLRIGYGLADSELISALNKIRLPFNVSLIAQNAAVAAIENGWYAVKVRDEVLKEKEKFYSVFDAEGIEYIRSQANFILLKIKDKSSKIIKSLLENGFIVRPGENLGIAGYIRVSISTPRINKLFLDKFTEIYRRVYGRAGN